MEYEIQYILGATLQITLRLLHSQSKINSIWSNLEA